MEQLRTTTCTVEISEEEERKGTEAIFEVTMTDVRHHRSRKYESIFLWHLQQGTSRAPRNKTQQRYEAPDSWVALARVFNSDLSRLSLQECVSVQFPELVPEKVSALEPSRYAHCLYLSVCLISDTAICPVISILMNLRRTDSFSSPILYLLGWSGDFWVIRAGL